LASGLSGLQGAAGGLHGWGAGLGRSVSSLAADPSGLVDSLKVRVPPLSPHPASPPHHRLTQPDAFCAAKRLASVSPSASPVSVAERWTDRGAPGTSRGAGAKLSGLLEQQRSLLLTFSTSLRLSVSPSLLSPYLLLSVSPSLLLSSLTLSLSLTLSGVQGGAGGAWTSSVSKLTKMGAGVEVLQPC
jgi:hypothetical protein